MAECCCLAEAAGRVDEEEDKDEDDGEDVGMAESLHSTQWSPALPAGTTGAAGEPGVTVMVGVTVPLSFLTPADAWQ